MSPQSLNEIIPGKPQPGVQHALSPLERVAVLLVIFPSGPSLPQVLGAHNQPTVSTT